MLNKFLKKIDKDYPFFAKANKFQDFNTNFNIELFLKTTGFLYRREYVESVQLSDYKSLERYRSMFLVVAPMYLIGLSMVYTVPLYLEFEWKGFFLAIPLTVALFILASKYVLKKGVRS